MLVAKLQGVQEERSQEQGEFRGTGLQGSSTNSVWTG